MDDVVDPQAATQYEELRRQLVIREELRAQNAPEAVASLRAQIASGAVKLKSDIKKSSAFVNRLKMLTENNAESLMKDIVELNLTRYVSECVTAIADAPLKLVDLPATVKVASLLHQRYKDFTALFVQTLVTVFDASYGADDKSKIVKRRILLRLLSELYLAGVYDDANVIVAIIQRVARREGGAPNKSRQKGNMSLGSGSGSGSSPAQLEVPLLVSFAKTVGVEFLGVRPKKFKDLESQLGDKFQTLIEKIHALAPRTVQKESLACFSEAYEMICKFYLAQHTAFVKLEARNEREEANRGEASDQHVQELENAKLLFDKLQTSVNALADALDREVPPLPLLRDDDGLNGSLLLWEADGSSRAMRADSPFDDEDTRAFYEDLPDLLELVPAVVLGLTEADLAELKKKKESATPNAAEEEAENENEADGDGDADDGEVEGDVDEDGQAMEDSGRERTESESESKQDNASTSTPATATSGASATTTGGPTSTATSYHHQHDAFFSSLEDLVNRDRCDKAAIDFCYRNSKLNRNRLIKTLFSVPRTHLELLPYYARLVATLQSVFKEDIGGELVTLLVNEFTHHIKKRNQFRLESKIKNIRFLAELVKFKICPPNVGFRCLKKCFGDFQGHNVLVATTFLENCGRFLYCSKHTHVRTETFLGIMMRLKSAKNLDPQAETLVQNAYYMCKPPERVERAVKQYVPLYLFIHKCLYQELNDTNVNKVVKTLRKLPWQDPSTLEYVLKAVLKVTKGKVMHMKLICEVVKGLTRYHDELSVLLIDEVLEIIRRGLQVNDYRDHQHSLGVVKLLGELYNCALVNMNVVLETLYLIIHHSHDLLSLPEFSSTPATSVTPPANVQDIKRRFLLVPDMRYDPRVPSNVDGSTEVFRIRLVCALIEACNSSSSSSTGASGAAGATGPGERGISKARLGRFMAFFQRYIFSKTEIPLETDFVVVDLFEALTVSLKDHFKRFETWEDADAAVQTILRGDLEEAERRFAKKNAALAAANPERTRESFGDAGIVPLSRAGEEDEDDDDEEEDTDDDDDDDDEEEEHGERAHGDDEEGDDGDDDDDDDEDEEEDDDDDEDDDEEEDEEEEQLIIHDRVQKTEEDDAFEKAFKSMMQSSADSRKLVGRVNVDKMAIPTVVKATGPPPSALTTGGGGGGGDGGAGAAAAGDSTSSALASPFGGNGPQGVVFRVLRRGNKGKVEARQLVVPEGSSLAQHSHRQENAGKKEQSELKRLVLQNIEREDFDSELDVGGVPAFAIAPRPSSSSQASQQQKSAPPPPPPPRDLNRSGFGLSSEWNNDEFGLRRGRGYRGQK